MPDHMATWLATYGVHSTLFLGSVAILSRVLRSDAYRDVLWKMALLGGVITTTVSSTLGYTPVGGNWTLEREVANTSLSPSSSVPQVVNALGGRERPGEVAAKVGQGAAGDRQGLGSMPWVVVLIGLWSAVAVVLLGRLAFHHVRLFSALRHRSLVRDESVVRMLYEIRRHAGVWRRIRLTMSEVCPTPIALGPSEICIPQRFLDDLNPDQQRAALAHELAHLWRRDPIWQLIAGVIESVFFFQPLNRVARLQLREAAEHLCDDWAVLHTTGSPFSMARCLADMSSWVGGVYVPERTLAMAEGGSPLLRRVERLVDWRNGGVQVSRLWPVGSAAVVALVAVAAPSVSWQRPTDREPHPEVESGTGMLAGQAGQAPRQECPFSSSDTLSFDAANVARLSVELPAGSITVVGGDDADSIRVQAVRCASTEAIRASLGLDMERDASEARLVEHLPTHLFSRTVGTTARMDVTVRLPKRLALRLEQGIGRVDLRNVSGVWLHDDLGDARINGIDGDVYVESGPGDIDVTGVNGSLQVAKTVGVIRVERIEGRVEIAKDHTGGVEINGVQSSVVIRDGQAGDVSVSNVRGDLLVGRMRSGVVRHRDVGGAVRIWSR